MESSEGQSQKRSRDAGTGRQGIDDADGHEKRQKMEDGEKNPGLEQVAKRLGIVSPPLLQESKLLLINADFIYIILDLPFQVPNKPYGEAGDNYTIGDRTLNEMTRRLQLDTQERQMALYRMAMRRGFNHMTPFNVSVNVNCCLLKN